MNWIKNYVRPKIRSLLRRDMPDKKWVKCPESGEMVFHRDLKENRYVVPSSGYHMLMPADARLRDLFDDGSFASLSAPVTIFDPFKFSDEKRYVDRHKQAVKKSGLDDAVLSGFGTLDGISVTAFVQDFSFMGGSLGVSAGEMIVSTMDHAVSSKTPLIAFVSSGGARMQEGIFSLMQLPKTVGARTALREAGLPYIVVLTHPTTGGVSASYAMLGDIHIAEPKALIGFAGPRVIEETIREKLPDGFQRSEYLLEHGMIDIISHRHDLRVLLSKLVRLLTHVPSSSGASEVLGDNGEENVESVILEEVESSTLRP